MRQIVRSIDHVPFDKVSSKLYLETLSYILIFKVSSIEWNLIDKEIQNCTSIAKFKKELLSIIRPVKNSTFRVFDITGIKLLTRLRLHFSALNEHRFRHAFDCISSV